MDHSTTWKIIDKYFDNNPQSLVRHHTESYNDFFKKGIFQIFKERNPLEIKTKYDESIDDYRSKCIMHFGGKNGDKIFLLSENESTYIPIGVTHALENPGKVELELIEVQSGAYLGEDDIVRLQDNYGRED